MQLTHTTAWDQHWGGGETLKRVLIYAAWLRLAQYGTAWISPLPCLMDPMSLRVTQNAYFSLLTPTKQLLSETFCDTLAGIEVGFQSTIIIIFFISFLFSSFL